MKNKNRTKKDNNQFAFDVLAMLISFVASYVAISWAIDSGSIFGYLLSCIGFYYGAHYLIKIVKQKINKCRKKNS